MFISKTDGLRTSSRASMPSATNHPTSVGQQEDDNPSGSRQSMSLPTPEESAHSPETFDLANEDLRYFWQYPANGDYLQACSEALAKVEEYWYVRVTL